jgi:hypothetical protein
VILRSGLSLKAIFAAEGPDENSAKKNISLIAWLFFLFISMQKAARHTGPTPKSPHDCASKLLNFLAITPIVT